ncbi:MAG: hypothetical protein OXI77_04415, partial [Chloroflexota bacterium]|nr:hypothetical protein [Chloroflexota bacterium]MDE2908973.1 hypothetical protein [Chloroflexota bacterium]
MSDSEVNRDALENSPIPPELIEYIPEEKREEIISRIVLQEQYSGPLAHPRIVAGYERQLPGSTDRIRCIVLDYNGTVSKEQKEA